MKKLQHQSNVILHVVQEVHMVIVFICLMLMCNIVNSPLYGH